MPRKGYVDAANRLRDPQVGHPYCASKADAKLGPAARCAAANCALAHGAQVQARVRAKLPAAVRRAYAQIVTGKLDMRAETARAAAQPRPLPALHCAAAADASETTVWIVAAGGSDGVLPCTAVGPKSCRDAAWTVTVGRA